MSGSSDQGTKEHVFLATGMAQDYAVIAAAVPGLPVHHAAHLSNN
jgi:hypothetical protein